MKNIVITILCIVGFVVGMLTTLFGVCNYFGGVEVVSSNMEIWKQIYVSFCMVLCGIITGFFSMYTAFKLQSNEQ